MVYQPEDVTRGRGEVESIRQMIDRAVTGLGVDAASVFICGLSAGGAMTAAMLAAYPELFAGGAIIAGLPYGAASNVSEALDAMYVGKIKDAPKWGDRVRDASSHAAPWPKVAIWHGTGDSIVKPINAGELVKQWTNVHEVGAEQPEIAQIGTATRRIWRNADGCECVTDYMIPGLGHGVPVDDVDPPAPFFLPAGPVRDLPDRGGFRSARQAQTQPTHVFGRSRRLMSRSRQATVADTPASVARRRSLCMNPNLWMTPGDRMKG